jgi:hypothetical protein
VTWAAMLTGIATTASHAAIKVVRITRMLFGLLRRSVVFDVVSDAFRGRLSAFPAQSEIGV